MSHTQTSEMPHSFYPWGISLQFIERKRFKVDSDIYEKVRAFRLFQSDKNQLFRRFTTHIVRYFIC